MAKTLYAALAETLKKQIGDGHYPVGSVLPSELALSAQHGLSRFTARAALATLERQRHALQGLLGVADQQQLAQDPQGHRGRDAQQRRAQAPLHLGHGASRAPAAAASSGLSAAPRAATAAARSA